MKNSDSIFVSKLHFINSVKIVYQESSDNYLRYLRDALSIILDERINGVHLTDRDLKGVIEI